MRRKPTITIKELHAHTGLHVRCAARGPVRVTDRGELVAVLVAPSLVTTTPEAKVAVRVRGPPGEFSANGRCDGALPGSRRLSDVLICDSSRLAKYYVQEAESAAVRSRLDAEDSVWCSELGRVELVSVFHRQLREKKLERAAFLALVGQFENDYVSGYWTWVPIDHSILEQVTKTYLTLPETVFMRTADCIHLVTAVLSRFSEIYTHDAVQSRAAGALGLRSITIS